MESPFYEDICNALYRSYVPNNVHSVLPTNIANQLLLIEKDLCNNIKAIKFTPPVAYMYNPLEYADDVHANYVRKYCISEKKILFLGMNPGPWGMSQTGVPFGEVKTVQDWLQLSGEIKKPHREHPDRQVTGFNCKRSEISGNRFWKLFKRLCHHPEKFFQYAYLRNYCPIALMRDTGRNITPVELKGIQRQNKKILEDECDHALVQIIQLLNVEVVIGIGRYAEEKAKSAIRNAGLNVAVCYMKHPSPQATGNQNWDEEAERTLNELGLIEYFKY